MKKSFKSHFASDVYHARTAIPEFTQAHAAEILGISLREYQFIESGDRVPGAEIFLRLVYLFELNIDNYREDIFSHVPVSSC